MLKEVSKKYTCVLCLLTLTTFLSVASHSREVQRLENVDSASIVFQDPFDGEAKVTARLTVDRGSDFAGLRILSSEGRYNSRLTLVCSSGAPRTEDARRVTSPEEGSVIVRCGSGQSIIRLEATIDALD